MAFPKQHLARHGGDNIRGVVHVCRPLPVAAKLEIVVEEDVRGKRLEFVRCEESSRAVMRQSERIARNQCTIRDEMMNVPCMLAMTEGDVVD